MIKVTPRGAGLIATLIVLTLFASALRDLLIALAALLIAVVLLASYLSAKRILNAECVVRPSVVRNKVWVWEKLRVNLELKCRDIETLSDLPSWLKLISLKGGADSWRAVLETRFRYHGIYRLDSIAVIRRAPLRLFIIGTPVRLVIEYRVLPETLYWIVIALRTIVSRGGIELVSLPLASRRSVAGEYYGTREYVPGDPLIRIDWRATARKLKLMIKEFCEEVSGGLTMIFDPRCLGSYTCDKVASAALSIAISACDRHVPLVILEVPELRGYRFLNPREGLRYLLARVLEMKIVDEVDIYEFVHPPTLSELREILPREVLAASSVEELKTLPKVLSGDAIYITTLVNDVNLAMQIVDLVRRSSKITVITPPRPWLDVRDPERAYRVYLTYSNVVEKLREVGVEIVEWISPSTRTTRT